MTAIVLERARTLREYWLEVPEVAYGHLLIQVEYGCVLDRDLDAFYHGTGKMPRVFGSALVGTILDGTRVAGAGSARIIPFGGADRRLQAGTRVMVFFDGTHDGALREYVVVPESRCHVLPAEIPEERLPLLPDAAIAAGVLTRLGVTAGHILLVLGARAAGVVLSVVAQWMGAQVVLADPSQPRLHQAEELGIQHTINPITASLPEELEWFTGGRVDFVVDTSGDPEFMPAAIAAMPPGSVLGLTVPVDYPFSFSDIVDNDIGVQSLTDAEPSSAVAVELAASVDLNRLISRSVPLIEMPAVVPAVIRERGTFLRLVGYTS